jgi:phosphoribosylanthranilate isomerase
MKVKICGITSIEDALAAIDAGCDLVGFNFYPPSPRYISPRNCLAIRNTLERHGAACTYVAVFVNAPLSTMQGVIESCGLHLAQLAGDELPELLDDLGGQGFKSIRPTNLQTALQQAAQYTRRGGLPALLVDAYRPGLYGGSGQTGDWELAKALASSCPLLLAGGLTPENVSRAVDQVRPWGVDVASGVESAPGKKDAFKMRTFIEAVRNMKEI